MSNLVYPVLPGRAFPSGRAVLPPKVRIRTTPSDREFRSRDALLPRYQYSVPYDWLRTRVSTPELQALVGFYLKVGGPFDSWLYLDPDDNTAAAESFGVGDGATAVWQLLRSFGGFAESVRDFVGSPTVYLTDWQGTRAQSTAARTNVLQQSSHLEASPWIRSGNTAGFDSGTTAPDGSAGLTAMSFVTSPANAYVAQPSAAAAVAGQTWTFSVWLQGSGTITLQVSDTAGVGSETSITLTAPLTRFSVSHTFAASPTGTVRCYITRRSYDTAVNVNAWGAQLEQAAAPTGYIRTTTAPVTLTSLVIGADGVVTLSPAPAAGVPLTWSGQFYRRCRFLGDRLDTERFMAGLFAAKRVEFISVKG